MTTLKVKVTKEAIQEATTCGMAGKGYWGKYCVIAEAVKPLFPHAVVGPSAIRPFYFLGEDVFVDESSWIYLPLFVQSYITKFDRSSVVERSLLPEIEFEVKIPDSIINQINIEELRPLLVNHPALELV